MSAPRYLSLVILLWGTLVSARLADAAVVFKDITGQVVTLPRPATRLVLAEGRQLIALSLIDDRPVDVLAGWLGDMRRNDRQTFELYRRRFPQIDEVPVLGMGNDGTLSLEKVIATKPDVAILGRGFAPEGHASDVARQLEAAGITVVFTDFFVDPFRNTVPSMRILGQVLGREAQAEAFVAFYQDHMNRVAARVATVKVRPSILVESHAGMAECCFSPGKKNFGEYIAFAGGDSISADIVPGPTGHLNLEYVIAKSPEIYVATGGSHLEASGGLVIGPGYDIQTIRQRLSNLAARPGFASIKAVQDGHVHGLFHNLMATPLNVVATEALAKWINPSLFADLTPENTLTEINARFLAVPFEGIYLADLK